jgi:hypothetical protein
MLRSPGAATGALLPLERLVLVTGNYGSGKSEVAVNWALHLARAGLRDLAIADLDVVNPYFRCREARVPLEEAGVRVVAPLGEHFHSELPIILPEIKGLLQRPDGVALLDVGGDDVGARVLHSFAGAFPAHEMLQVVNAFRPFTDTLAGCLRIQEEIQAASGLRVTGIVGNAHLMDDTTVDDVLRGVELAARVAAHGAQPLRFVTAPRSLATEVERRCGVPVLPLDRWLVPPWKPPPQRTVGPLFKT